jgi:hypothetical protein
MTRNNPNISTRNHRRTSPFFLVWPNPIFLSCHNSQTNIYQTQNKTILCSRI